MIPTRSLIALLVLALGYGTAAWCDDPPKAEAAPDPCITDLTLEKLDNPPQRKTKCEVVEAPQELPLNDVKLVDQKYVATVRILLPKTAGKPFERESPTDSFGRVSQFLLPGTSHGQLFVLQILYGGTLLNTSLRASLPTLQELQTRRYEPPEAGWKRILAEIPTERLPNKEVEAFFTSPSIQHYVFYGSSRTGGIGSEGKGADLVLFRQLQVLGPTTEIAKERTESVLSILDQGFSRPLQLALFKIREDQCRQMRANDETIAAAQAQLEEAAAGAKKESLLSADAISLLRVQHFHYEVERAGLQAKIDACQNLLNAGVPADRQKQIEEAKVASQIELAGCDARLTKSAAFLANVKSRDDLIAQQLRATEEVRSAQRRRQGFVKQLEKIDEELESFGPVRLLDNTVIIQPVEWTKKPEPQAREARSP